MRWPAVAAACLCLAACGAPMRWEKPGADDAMTRQDMSICRAAARDEAMRTYMAYSGPLSDSRYWLVWHQQAEVDRFYVEANLTRFCMRNKGYELVPVPQPAKSENG